MIQTDLIKAVREIGATLSSTLAVREKFLRETGINPTANESAVALVTARNCFLKMESNLEILRVY